MLKLRIPLVICSILNFSDISAVVPKPKVLTAYPTCNPTYKPSSWTSCSKDSNAWYWLAGKNLDFGDAVRYCEGMGAKLFAATSSTKRKEKDLDQCAASLIDERQAYDTMVLYSGRYISAVDSWLWCSDNDCQSAFNYTNWIDGYEGNCMGGYFNSQHGSYGWVKRNCQETLARAICRYDCDDIVPPTQDLMYTVYRGDSVYHYKIADSGTPVKKGIYKIPYASDFPRIAYNYQLSNLELVGDYWADFNSTSNSYHYRMSDFGYFAPASQSLWSPVKFGSLVYIETVGTMCIGGQTFASNGTYYNEYTTQIVSQNTNWPAVSKSDNKLRAHEGNGYKFLGVTTNKNTIYLVGGYGFSNYSDHVQSLNLDNVKSLSDAQAVKWNLLGHLGESVAYATLQFVESQLFIVGFHAENRFGNELQVFDLQTNQTTKYSDVYSTGFLNGVYYAGSWLSNGNMTIFGGYDSKDCVQQTGSLSDPGAYWGDTCDNSIIEGTTLGGIGQRINYASIFG